MGVVCELRGYSAGAVHEPCLCNMPLCGGMLHECSMRYCVTYAQYAVRDYVSDRDALGDCAVVRVADCSMRLSGSMVAVCSGMV